MKKNILCLVFNDEIPKIKVENVSMLRIPNVDLEFDEDMISTTLYQNRLLTLYQNKDILFLNINSCNQGMIYPTIELCDVCYFINIHKRPREKDSRIFQYINMIIDKNNLEEVYGYAIMVKYKSIAEPELEPVILKEEKDLKDFLLKLKEEEL